MTPVAGTPTGEERAMAETFERNYAARAGLRVSDLRSRGRIVATCDCDDEGCEGFQSTTAERLSDYQGMGRPWIQVLP